MPVSLRSVLVLALGLALAGCQSSGGDQAAASGQPSSWRLAFFGNPQAVPPEKPIESSQRDLNCPSVGVLEGGAAHRIGRQGGSEVSHQASLVDTARECRFAGNSMTLKVGVQGRLLIGAAGRAGTYTVPVRVAVKRGEAVVASRFARVSVTIPANEVSASFVHIEDNIALPVSDNDPAEEYDIYVGFDEGGGPADPRRGTRRR